MPSPNGRPADLLKIKDGSICKLIHILNQTPLLFLLVVDTKTHEKCFYKVNANKIINVLSLSLHLEPGCTFLFEKHPDGIKITHVKDTASCPKENH